MSDKLQIIIDELKGMQCDVASLLANAPTSIDCVLEAISTANDEQCVTMLKAIMSRVEELEFDATMIEDAIVQLEADIAEQDLLDNPPLCARCNGSGEGQHEGSRCFMCGGTGTVKGEKE